MHIPFYFFRKIYVNISNVKESHILILKSLTSSKRYFKIYTLKIKKYNSF